MKSKKDITASWKTKWSNMKMKQYSYSLRTHTQKQILLMIGCIYNYLWTSWATWSGKGCWPGRVRLRLVIVIVAVNEVFEAPTMQPLKSNELIITTLTLNTLLQSISDDEEQDSTCWEYLLEWEWVSVRDCYKRFMFSE